jgi:plasminogen activator inhibitor 1 RNA-binding protein
LYPPFQARLISDSEHPKQAAHGWGGPSGNDELADEKAGDAIAKAEEAEGFDTTVPAPQNADGETWGPDTSGDAGEPAEPEGPASKSYDEYLAEQAEKKLQLSGGLAPRKPNEGASKKFPEGKAFDRKEEDFFAGSGGKNTRVREKKEKQTLDMSDVDPRQFLAQADSGDRGGRGGRGRGRGRGDGDRADRGDRGDRPSRGDRGEGGERRGRGGFRGDRGDRPPRGDFRGGRGGRGGAAPPRADDNRAFPSLGGN